MKLLTGFFMAWGNFCAIPCPHKVWDEKARKQMLVAFPLIGLLIGAVWYLLWFLCMTAELSSAITAVLMTAYPFVISGFIHLDGFMDCSDAILSRRPLEQRQKILKDSHVGAFAVIAAILLFLAVFAAMWTLAEANKGVVMLFLAEIPVLSRVSAAVQVLSYKPLSTSQYDKSFDPEENKRYKVQLIFIGVSTDICITLLIGYITWKSMHFNDFSGLIAVGCYGIITLTASVLAGCHGRSQLGGMNGDISGYSIVYSELAAIMAMAIITL